MSSDQRSLSDRLGIRRPVPGAPGAPAAPAAPAAQPPASPTTTSPAAPATAEQPAAPPKAPESDPGAIQALPKHVADLIDDFVTTTQNELQMALEELGDNPNDPKTQQQRREKVRDIVTARLKARRQANDSKILVLTPDQQSKLIDAVVSEVVGFGPMDVLLNDKGISEVMVNGPKRLFYERKGRLVLSPITFKDDEHVLRIIKRILDPIGRRVDTSQPLEDARLPDGSRVNVIIPPLALDGPSITIRKFPDKRLTLDDYYKFGSLSEAMGQFIVGAVKAKLNIVVSGGTGSGKTTLLNLLSSFIPEGERIVTIEDAAELRLVQEHVVRLEARKPNIEGKGEVTIRDLVKNSLRMRPDRIVVGECRSGEALDMLQAMNTGHDGSLTTLHANSPRDAIARMETLCLMSGVDLPQRAIREQIVKAVDLVVQISRLRDGSRKVMYVTELQGRLEGDTPVLQDIFVYEHRGFDEQGKAVGTFKVKALRPHVLGKFEEQGVVLPEDLFLPS